MAEGYPNNNSALFDDNGGADLDPVEEINHLIVHHPDAPGGNGLAYAPGLGCAVNAVFGVADIKGTRAQWIFRATRHERWNDVAFFGFTLNHHLWRTPIGPGCLAGNRILA